MVLLIHKFLFWLFEIFWKDKETFVFLLCLENNLPLAHINSDLLNKNYCKKKKKIKEREREKKKILTFGGNLGRVEPWQNLVI